MGDMKIVSQGIADAQKATSDGGRKVSVAEAKNIITHAQAAGVSDSDIKSGFKHAGPQLEKAYAEAVKELSKAPASSAADKAMISVMSSDGGSDPRPAKDIVNQQ